MRSDKSLLKPAYLLDPSVGRKEYSKKQSSSGLQREPGMSLWIHEPRKIMPFLSFDYKAEKEIKMLFVVIDPFKPFKISQSDCRVQGRK